MQDALRGHIAKNIRELPINGLHSMSRAAVWKWAQAVRQSDLPSLAKLVCLNLYLYMRDLEGGCFPSLSQQMRDTSLARSTLVQHLKTAQKRGYLIIEKSSRNGHQQRNRYIPNTPKGINIFNNGNKNSAIPSPVPSRPSPELGSTAHGQNLVREVNSNYIYNYPINYPFNNDSVEEDWEEGDS